MNEVILLGILGAVLAWAMMPASLHPDVERRLRTAIPRRHH